MLGVVKIIVLIIWGVLGRGSRGFMGVGMLEYHKKSIRGAPWSIDFRWNIGAKIDGKWGVNSHLEIVSLLGTAQVHKSIRNQWKFCSGNAIGNMAI